MKLEHFMNDETINDIIEAWYEQADSDNGYIDIALGLGNKHSTLARQVYRLTFHIIGDLLPTNDTKIIARTVYHKLRNEVFAKFS